MAYLSQAEIHQLIIRLHLLRISIQHCHHAFHSTLINLEIQSIHLMILTGLRYHALAI